MALILAVILAYIPVWWAGFVWDDGIYITENPGLNGLHGLVQIWTTRAADISPLTFTTFWFEHALWGLSPLPYHLVNVLLHGACAIALWQVLRRLQVPGAWLGASLWALHPVQAESVAWVTETKNTQSGLFFLLAILFFLQGLEMTTSPSPRARFWNDALTLVFAALAMASKSSTVVLPLVLGLCAWWKQGRWQTRNVVEIGLIFLMSLGSAALSLWTQALVLQKIDPQWARSWPERVATAGDVVWFYLGKLFWPYPLMSIYPRWVVDAGQSLAYLPWLAVIVVSLVLWIARQSWSRAFLFAWAFFLAALLPVLGLFDNPLFRYSFVFDHFQYLASMGPLALAGAGMAILADRFLPGKPWVLTIIGSGLLLLLGTLSWQRACVFESEETLWTDTVSKNPNSWSAHSDLGAILAQKGHFDDAIAHYQTALALNPHDAEACYNYGNVLARLGRMDEAQAWYEKAIAINPDYAEARTNLGNVYLTKGRVREAIDQYQKALAIDPDYAPAQTDLAKAQATSRSGTGP